MLKLILYAVLIYFGYHMLRAMGVFPFGKKKKVEEDLEDASATDADLIQDPHCKKYFMKTAGVTGVHRGRTIHFCSAACRDAYLEIQKRE